MAKLELPSLHLVNDKVGNNLWITMNDYPFMLDGRLMFIPLFFIHDKYSVPFGIIIPRDRKEKMENIPAVLHDYIVRYRNVLKLSLPDCHDVFLQAMRLCGLPVYLRWAKYTAVMCFNWMIAGDGMGTPPRQVQAFIDKHGYGC
jgi:hypothetical protein